RSQLKKKQTRLQQRDSLRFLYHSGPSPSRGYLVHLCDKGLQMLDCGRQLWRDVRLQPIDDPKSAKGEPMRRENSGRSAQSATPRLAAPALPSSARIRVENLAFARLRARAKFDMRIELIISAGGCSALAGMETGPRTGGFERPALE
uniref:C2 tensin-type domain-containing protein n=1 Tax=Macrostomum lignano TaxID=282301 RepID=A0A1I8IQD7_9PLAT